MMKFILAIALLGAGAGLFLALQPGRAVAAATPAATTLPEVSVGRTSDDAREAFTFRMFAPWSDAEHRVIVLNAAGVEANGFVSQAYVSSSDASVDESFTAGGPRNRMVVRRNVASWSLVTSTDQLTVIVEPVN
jgi:hypothetical protein